MESLQELIRSFLLLSVPPVSCFLSQFEGTRDAEDIRCFWQNFLHPSISKTRWSQEEVQQLKKISKKHGARDWETIAAELGVSMSVSSCLSLTPVFRPFFQLSVSQHLSLLFLCDLSVSHVCLCPV